jgi:hypothetical protein
MCIAMLYLSACYNRTWSSLVTMMPKGGDIIWGNSTYAADDIADMIKGI